MTDEDRRKRVEAELKRKAEQRNLNYGAPNPYRQALNITSKYKGSK